MIRKIPRPRFLLLAILFVASMILRIAILKGESSSIYTALERGFYLSAQDTVWIRPGLKLEIQNVTIPADRKVQITFKLTDDMGQPLDRTGVFTPATVSTSFCFGYLPADGDQYVSYTTRTVTSPITKVTARQASTDSGGKYELLGDGIYTYTFATAIPDSYDRSATHTVGIYASRDLTAYGLTRYVANSLKNFVPDGRQVAKVRDVVATDTCNQCHNPLALHGGSRREASLCILCHTPQSTDPDTGNTVDFKVMIHKIHMGKDLPSVKAGKAYQIIGNAQSTHDFSTVAFPRDIRSCDTCHSKAVQADSYLLNPTRAACGSCHDDVNFATGENHIAGAQLDDKECASCHTAEGEFEYDASIKGAHTPPYRSTQLLHPKFEITKVMNTQPGQKPMVHFKVTDKDGNAIDPSTMARLSLRIAGPTTDYSWYLSETANAATPNEDGTYKYSFKGVLPADAKGSYSVGLEGYFNTTLNPGTAKELVFRDTGDNVVKFFAVTGSTVTPRRQVVDNAKCNKCHERLALHGGSRNDAQYCGGCHNPTMTDAARRPATENPAESIDFKRMIHRIHTGEELSNDFSIYGYGSAKINFNEVRFPGDRRDCTTCHLANTYTLPLSKDMSPVKTPRDYWTPTAPIAAACLGCHDSTEAAAHAYVNTTSFGESCVVCHKEGADYAVSKVHAR
jgi:OmcA/MtrC family decaheme c-type cytochrome